MIAEVAVVGNFGKRIVPDGTIKNVWELDVGYWESKDEKTNLDAEIQAKINKGYPLNNILFEDSATAVLYQYGNEVARCSIRDAVKIGNKFAKFVKLKK